MLLIGFFSFVFCLVFFSRHAIGNFSVGCVYPWRRLCADFGLTFYSMLGFGLGCLSVFVCIRKLVSVFGV